MQVCERAVRVPVVLRCAALRAGLAGCKVVDRARTFPEPSTPRLGRPRSHSPPTRLSRTPLGCPSPHTRLFVFVGFVNVVFVRESVSSTRCRE